MINNLKSLIENKLSCIDIATKEGCLITKQYHELQGIKQALDFMGFKLELSFNPYYGTKDDTIGSSTYVLTLKSY